MSSNELIKHYILDPVFKENSASHGSWLSSEPLWSQCSYVDEDNINIHLTESLY